MLQSWASVTPGRAYSPPPPPPMPGTRTSVSRSTHYLLGQTVLPSEGQSRDPWPLREEERTPCGFRCALAKKLPGFIWTTDTGCPSVPRTGEGAWQSTAASSRQLSLAMSTSFMGPRDFSRLTQLEHDGLVMGILSVAPPLLRSTPPCLGGCGKFARSTTLSQEARR